MIDWGQVCLLNGKLLLHHRRDNRLRQRLRVFFMHQHLDIWAVYVGRGRVVLLVFVEDYGVGWAFVHLHQLLVVGISLVVVVVEDIGVGCLAGALDIVVGLGLADEISKPGTSQSRSILEAIVGAYSS